MSLLSVREITKSYPAPGKPLEVLKGVSFELEAGSGLAVMGPSGSGKSTLLNIIGALDAPTSGTVIFDGLDVQQLAAPAAAQFRNKEIGFVFQDHHLLPQCTAQENVLLPCLAFGRADAEQAQRSLELLALVGLSDRAGHLPGQLSGGERQRAAIARALMQRPRLLICDEPTGNLDSGSAQAIVKLFVDLCAQEHIALLAVTHNQEVARQLGRCLTLQDGRLCD